MSENTAPVLAFGELLWDLLPDGKVLGGAPANFAYRLSELGTPVRLVSRIGNDPWGTEAVQLLSEKKLSDSSIQRDSAHPTGTVNVTLSDKGDANYTIVPNVAYDFIELTDDLVALARKASALCFGTLIQRSTRSRETLYALLESGSAALKVLDINLRKDCYSVETLLESLRRSDVLKLNREEVRVVSTLLGLNAETPEKFAAAVFKRFTTRLVLVTQGSDGVIAFPHDGTSVSIPGFRVTVADTVGSGDNFTAAFLHLYLKNASLEDCCRFANRVGAVTASKKGGMPYITPSEIEAI